ncbi:cell division protein PerM [Sanguibacter sp. Z1732]|uniref:cell division protein PerM n=1 Tax=Sanguibacter sp. Z1732 TaxID=3435412 RepID=UPI003D9C90A3
MVAVVGSVWGMRGRYPRAPGALARWRLPQWLRLAGRATWRATAALLAVATALLIVAVALGFDQIVQIQRSLQADPVSTVVIVLAQVVLLPVLIVWALAFLLGPGFTVGAGTLFSTAGIESGPLPVIPVLGALPEPDSLAGSLPLTAGAGVVVGLLVGWWLLLRGNARRRCGSRWPVRCSPWSQRQRWWAGWAGCPPVGSARVRWPSPVRSRSGWPWRWRGRWVPGLPWP